MSAIATALHAMTLPATAPQSVHLLPAGTFSGRDGRGPWRLDNPSQVIAATHAHAKGVKLLIDYDHQSDFAAVPGIGGRAKAAAWITHLDARPNGLWGRVEWTPAARAAIQAREYRYISPVFHHDRRTGQVIRVLKAALTNTPNLNQLTAICTLHNRRDFPMDNSLVDELAAWLGLADGANDPTVRAALAKRLGLLETVSTPDLIAALDHALSLSGNPATAAQQAGSVELQALQAMVADQLVETAICSGTLPPAGRDAAVALCRENPAAFRDFITAIGPVFSYLTQPMVPGTPPPSAMLSGSRLTQGEMSVCRNLGIDAERYLQGEGTER